MSLDSALKGQRVRAVAMRCMLRDNGTAQLNVGAGGDLELVEIEQLWAAQESIKRLRAVATAAQRMVDANGGGAAFWLTAALDGLKNADMLDL